MMIRVRRWAFAMGGVALLSGSCEDPQGLASVGIVAVTITPDTATLLAGDTVRLIGTATDADGVGYAGTAPHWLSSDPTVAAVSQGGLVTAIGPGAATITATVLDWTGSAAVTVEVAPSVVLSTNALNFTATVGGSDPADQAVTITNGGAGTLAAVTVGGVTHGSGQPAGWLTAELSANPYTVTIRVSVTGLAVGTYDATVGVGIDGASGATLTVTLVVS